MFSIPYLLPSFFFVAQPHVPPPRSNHPDLAREFPFPPSPPFDFMPFNDKYMLHTPSETQYLAMNDNEAQADCGEIRHPARDHGLSLLLDTLLQGPPI